MYVVLQVVLVQETSDCWLPCYLVWTMFRININFNWYSGGRDGNIDLAKVNLDELVIQYGVATIPTKTANSHLPFKFHFTEMVHVGGAVNMVYYIQQRRIAWLIGWTCCCMDVWVHDTMNCAFHYTLTYIWQVHTTTLWCYDVPLTTWHVRYDLWTVP